MVDALAGRGARSEYASWTSHLESKKMCSLEACTQQREKKQMHRGPPKRWEERGGSGAGGGGREESVRCFVAVLKRVGEGRGFGRILPWL